MTDDAGGDPAGPQLAAAAQSLLVLVPGRACSEGDDLGDGGP